jgi:hypothetical protein
MGDGWFMRVVARSPIMPAVDGFHEQLMVPWTVAVPIVSILQKV